MPFRYFHGFNDAFVNNTCVVHGAPNGYGVGLYSSDCDLDPSWNVSHNKVFTVDGPSGKSEGANRHAPCPSIMSLDSACLLVCSSTFRDGGGVREAVGRMVCSWELHRPGQRIYPCQVACPRRAHGRSEGTARVLTSQTVFCPFATSAPRTLQRQPRSISIESRPTHFEAKHIQTRGTTILLFPPDPGLTLKGTASNPRPSGRRTFIASELQSSCAAEDVIRRFKLVYSRGLVTKADKCEGQPIPSFYAVRTASRTIMEAICDVPRVDNHALPWVERPVSMGLFDGKCKFSVSGMYTSPELKRRQRSWPSVRRRRINSGGHVPIRDRSSDGVLEQGFQMRSRCSMKS